LHGWSGRTIGGVADGEKAEGSEAAPRVEPSTQEIEAADTQPHPVSDMPALVAAKVTSTWRAVVTAWNGQGYVESLTSGDSFFLKSVLVRGQIDASLCANGMTWAQAQAIVDYVTESNRRRVTIA